MFIVGISIIKIMCKICKNITRLISFWNKRMSKMIWSSQSPDVNPSENMQLVMKVKGKSVSLI